MEKILTIEERLQYLEDNNPNIEIEIIREELYSFEDDELQHLCLDDFDVPRTNLYFKQLFENSKLFKK
jgi:hypothetical protein